MEEYEPEEMSAAGGTAKKKSKSRTHRVTVCLSEDEKAQLDNQKGRLSTSEFLRDRWLKPAHPHDPTYEAIGSVYQAALDLRASRNAFEQVQGELREISTLLCTTSSEEEMSSILAKLDACLKRLEAVADGMPRSAEIVTDLAREMSGHHLAEVCKHRPLPKTKRRKLR